MNAIEVHILHDRVGRILAIAPAAPVADDDGVQRGVTPVPVEGQRAVRLTLTEAHAAAGPAALVRDFEVDVDIELPALRPRAER